MNAKMRGPLAMQILRIFAIALIAVIGFSLAACDGGTGSTTPTGPTDPSGGDSDVLPAPTGLKAEPVSPTSILIEWNAVTGAKWYRIYASRSSSSGFVLQGKDNIESTSVLHKELSPNTTYYYKVAAYDANGKEGAMSSAVEVTTPKQ